MAKAKDGQRVFRHSPDMLWRHIAGEVVILDKNSTAYYSLNEVGSRIWELIGRGQNQAGIVDEICREFDADEARVERDLCVLLKQLSREKLILPAA